MRLLPDKLRDKLKEPIGRFFVDEKELIGFLKNEKYIVSVGDQVTYTLLKNNISPIFCVVDFKIKRNLYSSDFKKLIKSFGKKMVRVKNRQGEISDELWEAIKTAYNVLEEGSQRIEVIGEEDMASLAAIFLAPRSDVTIIYGLPDKGVVVVKATDENKLKVKEVLDEM
ncbi:MAG: DUF359 domain-containing protein [Candidatus Thermoplasmatota archaeon]|jgi:uncharacterized protein (UPF0218 family)|nr:DUF359 domain-containing protein [Candidatus Thermoplasmatota archaeon]